MNKDRMTVLAAMMDQGVIPVFYHPDVEVCKKVIQACANGGAKCIEFTNRGDFASHVFFEVTRHFDKADPERDHGRRARSSMRPRPASTSPMARSSSSGPILNADVAKVCNRRCIPYSPGCGSASEISYAHELGLRNRQGVPGQFGGRTGVRQERAGPHAVDAHHAHRRRRAHRGIAAQVVSARASSPAASAAISSPRNCWPSRITPASKRACATPSSSSRPFARSRENQ